MLHAGLESLCGDELCLVFVESVHTGALAISAQCDHWQSERVLKRHFLGVVRLVLSNRGALGVHLDGCLSIRDLVTYGPLFGKRIISRLLELKSPDLGLLSLESLRQNGNLLFLALHLMLQLTFPLLVDRLDIVELLHEMLNLVLQMLLLLDSRVELLVHVLRLTEVVSPATSSLACSTSIVVHQLREEAVSLPF